VTYEEYLKLIKQQQAAQLSKDRGIINSDLKTALQAEEDAYNEGVAEVNQSYTDAIRKNETQRLLNQRAIERKAAEMGLTDSGFNRTQQTANQIASSNAASDVELAKAKAVNTLAATMRANKLKLQSGAKASISELENAYDKAASDTATDLYKADLDAAEKQNKASAERTKTYNTLLSDIADAVDDNTKLAKIHAYTAFYDDVLDEENYYTTPEIRSALKAAGISLEDWRNYYMEMENIEKPFTPSSQVMPIIANNPISPMYTPRSWNK
jgi:hypothetical protein